jgi:hypothetical protein
VICCPGHPAEFEDTLVSVLQNRPPQCEVLVVHAHRYDDPYDLSDEVLFRHVAGRPSLTELANRGLQTAEGEIVHLLDCRLTATEGWAEEALAKFEDPEVVAVSPLVISAVDKRVVSAGVSYGIGGARKVAGTGLELKSPKASKLNPDGPTLAAGFYRRETLLAIGGWQELLSVYAADVDLAQRMQALELRTAVASNCHLLEARPEHCPAGFSRGRAMERLFWQQHSARKSILSLIAHAFVVCADALMRLPKGEALTTLIGRTVGLLHSGTKETYSDQLAAAQEALALLQDEALEPGTLSMTDAREELNQAANRVTRRAA